MAHPTSEPAAEKGVMSPNNSFAELMARLRAGEDAAAREVFRRFTRQLIALANRQFGAVLKHKVDPEDVVQSAYKSFFVRFGEGKIEVGNWDSLWGLLTLITLRKCADRAAYYGAQRRDAAREVSAQPGSGEAAPWREAIDREPTPVEAAILTETVARLLGDLDEDERPIIDMSLQGYTAQEISKHLGRAERSVRRLRERVKKRLERMQLEAEAE
jgi:RNA polymerase sigma-70 factor (ECF subfamily)